MNSASPERRSLRERFPVFGTYPGMPFDLRRETYILNGCAWAVIAGATAFIVTWLFVHKGPSVVPNLIMLAVGIGSLWLLSRRRYQATVILINTVGGVIFLYQSLLFRTGAHAYLLSFIVTSAFLIRRAVWRRLIVLAQIVGYIAVEAYQFGPRPPGAVAPGRYLTNLVIAAGLIYLFCALFRKTSDAYRRRLDERNRELQEANAAKEKIFSILAHDLRGPIAALKGGLDLLDDRTITPAEFAEMKDDLKKGVDSVFDSMESLLEWSAGQMHAPRHHPSRVDLRAACGDTLRLLERTAFAKGIAVENRLEEGTWAAADLHQVHAVFRNLVSNALKFTPAGGRVEVSAEIAGPGWWRVAVRDSGVGIDAGQAARLFDGKTFESTRGTANEKGMGLGLQICRDFVRVHGGEIAMESVPGKGSVFRFTLPAWSGEVSIPKAGPNC